MMPNYYPSVVLAIVVICGRCLIMARPSDAGSRVIKVEKNDYYVHPPIMLGDSALIQVPIHVDGEIHRITFSCEGQGCPWTHECSGGASGPCGGFHGPYSNNGIR